MNPRFYRGKAFAGIGDKSLEEWFTEMIEIARQIDLGLAYP